MANFTLGALQSTNPLTQMKLQAGNAIGMPLGSLAPASGGAIGAYYGRKGMSGGVTPAVRPTDVAALHGIATGQFQPDWWAQTGNVQGNLYANQLQNEHIIPSGAITPPGSGGGFGYMVNPNITDPALRAGLGAYTKGLNADIWNARNISSWRGGEAAGPLGPVTMQQTGAGYQALQAANPDTLPQFTNAQDYGKWKEGRNDEYHKLYLANKLAGVQGVGYNSPGLEALKKSNPELYKRNMAFAPKLNEIQYAPNQGAMRGNRPMELAAPGEQTAGNAMAGWRDVGAATQDALRRMNIV